MYLSKEPEFLALKMLIEKRAKEFIKDVELGDEYDPPLRELINKAKREKEDGKVLDSVVTHSQIYQRACHSVIQKNRLW